MLKKWSNLKPMYVTIVGVLYLALSLGEVTASPIEAGYDVFPSIGMIEITTLPNSLGIPIFTETISLKSTTTQAIVHRDEQVGNVIDTELVSLDLFGSSINLGPLHVRVGTGNAIPVSMGPSLGRIENVVQDLLDPGFSTGDPSSFFSGDSFFDVFFEIDVAGVTIFNAIPARIEASIEEIPPIGAEYVKIGSLFGWIIGQDPLTDAPIIEIVNVTHTPIPEPTTMLLFGSGLIGLAAGARRKCLKSNKD